MLYNIADLQICSAIMVLMRFLRLILLISNQPSCPSTLVSHTPIGEDMFVVKNIQYGTDIDGFAKGQKKMKCFGRWSIFMIPLDRMRNEIQNSIFTITRLFFLMIFDVVTY